jgi:nucleoside-diphosphate-sugar epimerase
MKLVVAGSTGFVATEIIRQALAHPDVTSVVAIGRREATVPTGLRASADESKFKSVILKDFEYYPDDVKAALANSDAVIW